MANWITHAVGFALSIAALFLLIDAASTRGNAWHSVTFAVFGLTLLMLYAASTFYHATEESPRKTWLHRLDHAAIFLLIAGTYTPILLVGLRDSLGWTFLVLVWGISGVGAALKLACGVGDGLFSVVAYLILGWFWVLASAWFGRHLQPGGLALLLAGCLCYSAGVPFYIWRRLRYHHAVWHLFVLGGSICHFFVVLHRLLPRSV